MPKHPDRDPTVPPAIPSPDESAITRTYTLPVSLGTDVPSGDRETQVQLADTTPGAAGTMPVPLTCGTGVAPVAGRYVIVREIGRGGMGVVLEAEDQQLDRRLALKVLLEQHAGDPALVQRFLDEARICGQLQHPGIVPVHELGRLPDQRPFFAMKLIQGQTLAALLRARQSPAEDLPRFLTIFEQVCQTMAYAHAHDVIHRDLKPANIMVVHFGEVQVMDWGLAKMLNEGTRGEGREKKKFPPSPLAPHPSPLLRGWTLPHRWWER